MISIITPTHNCKFLKEAYESLLAQDFSGWEWILVPNNGNKIPDEIANDPHVRVHPLNIVVENIGSLKSYACSKAQGEIIVEFDHDDILMPTALSEIIKAFEEPAVVFAYSNTVEFHDGTWAPYTYSADYGWRYRQFDYQGHPLQEAIAFEPTPQAIAYIWYAPNHLRAWRKDVYDRIGGHDITMKVIDDHDLMCRMFLAGKFFHIDKPLYLYRVHGKNSWLEKNQLVQQTTRATYAKYIYQLVETWCDRNNLLRIDLGSNRGAKPAGWKTVDIRGGDFTADLNGRWPFEDNSVGAIRAWDILEHLPDKIHSMNEMHRVLVPGGWVLSGTPSTDGRGAFQDPTHVSYWNQNSFWYYTKKGYQNFVPEITARFQSFRNETIFPSDFHKANDIPYVVSDMVAIKAGYDRPENHIPALVEI